MPRRRTLHEFVMREAASTGGLKDHPTTAQANWLKSALAHGYLPMAVQNAPVASRTKAICEQRGWAEKSDGAYWITPAGRLAGASVA